jgi:hypothetical protein
MLIKFNARRFSWRRFQNLPCATGARTLLRPGTGARRPKKKCPNSRGGAAAPPKYQGDAAASPYRTMKYWGWSFPANLTLTSRPIQPQSGFNPTQSDPIRPNPTYDKKINPRNRVTRLLKKYD